MALSLRLSYVKMFRITISPIRIHLSDLRIADDQGWFLSPNLPLWSLSRNMQWFVCPYSSIHNAARSGRLSIKHRLWHRTWSRWTQL